MNTLRPVREKALNDIAAVVASMWGDRCPQLEGGCSICAAWTVFDALARLTDGSTLDEAADFENVAERFRLDR